MTDKHLDWLVQAGIATDEDREEFDWQFTQTERPSATPRPGLTVSRRWPITEAEKLDASGKFTAEVRHAYQTLVELSLT